MKHRKLATNKVSKFKMAHIFTEVPKLTQWYSKLFSMTERDHEKHPFHNQHNISFYFMQNIDTFVVRNKCIDTCNTYF